MTKSKQSKLMAWQLWFHYVLLEAIVLLALGLSGIETIEAIDIGILYVAIAVGDQAIHFVLGKLTGWKD